MVVTCVNDDCLSDPSAPMTPQLIVTPGTIACLTLLSMGFSRQEYWSELHFPSPGESF